ncbi:MAG: carboxylesterase family protein, partial [Lachnospiraceae bacterium]|nr:carboxylesterase family protein [Lachnospiraceae bacterium]
LSEGMLGSVSKDARPLIQAMLDRLNLTEADVEQLETIPYARLAQVYNEVVPALREKGEYTGCMPRPGKTYVGDPLMVGFRKETAHIPLMVGTVFGEFDFVPLTYNKETLTREEGISILKERLGAEAVASLLPMFETAYPERNPVDLLSLDTLFRPDAMRYIRKRGQAGKAPVYAYQFNLDFLQEHGKAAWHCSDIPYFFHNTRMAPALNIPGVTEKLEEQMFQCLMAFARTGNPNHAGIPDWESSTGTEEKTLLFGREVVSRTNFDEKLIPALLPVAREYKRKRMASAHILH